MSEGQEQRIRALFEEVLSDYETAVQGGEGIAQDCRVRLDALLEPLRWRKWPEEAEDALLRQLKDACPQEKFGRLYCGEWPVQEASHER